MVLVSVEEYNRLKRGQAASGWEELLEEIRRVRASLVGRPPPAPAAPRGGHPGAEGGMW